MIASPCTRTFDPDTWAEQTFGSVELGDKRRTARAVQLACAMARNPSASLPTQLRLPAALKAAYRLLREADVTFQALVRPHWDQTRAAAAQEPLVLLVQDTTELDYTHFPTIEDLAAIGNGTGRGILLQSVLALLPTPRRVLGLLQQEPFLRQPAPKGESYEQRQKRPRESQVWTRAVEAVGVPPEGARWVHVGDRYSDIFDFLAACRAQSCHFLVRVARDRRIAGAEEEEIDHLMTASRAEPSQDERVLHLPARHGKPARDAQLHLSMRPVTVLSPRHGPKRPPIEAWVVRVWEVDPPAEGEPLEWILLTSVPTETVAAGWERVGWYTCRWVAEDYHQCLKTGCSIERRHLGKEARLERVLGFYAPLAVHLLQIRDAARLEPELPAPAVVPLEVVQVVAAVAQLPLETLTVGRLWREVAQLGGYQGRRGDGPPGWKTLWRGWQYIQILLQGVHLAAHLTPDPGG